MTREQHVWLRSRIFAFVDSALVELSRRSGIKAAVAAQPSNGLALGGGPIIRGFGHTHTKTDTRSR